MMSEPVRKISFDEFLALPETTPVSEYINAQVVQKAAASNHLKALKRDIDRNISLPLNKVKGGYSPLITRCNFDNLSIVPDVCIFSERRIFPDNNPVFLEAIKTGTVDNYPDWTIDFLPPEPDIALLNARVSGCLDAGTEACWFINVPERQLLIYTSDTSPQLFNDDKIPLPVPSFIEGISLTLGTVFHWINI